MNPKTFGQILKKARYQKGMTQEQLAQVLGVTNRTISRWERGVNLPDYDTLLQICEYFQIPVQEILTGQKSATIQKKKWYQRYYATMNQFNYHATQVIFNIINIIIVFILYNNDVFGPKTYDFSEILISFFKQTILLELFIFGIPCICIIIYTFKNRFQNIKNYPMNKLIHIELITYNLIFIPISLIITGFIIYLWTNVQGSAFVIAFCDLFLNMTIFHYCYVMKSHKYIDQLWVHKENS